MSGIHPWRLPATNHPQARLRPENGMKRKKKPAKKAAPRIERPRLAGPEMKRNPIRDAKRAFAIDGTHVYFRRKKANPAMKERVDAKIRSGEYTHVRTDDGVETYAISEDSPLRRRKLDLTEMSGQQIEQHIIVAACGRDWKLYYDAVSELAYRYKNGNLPAGNAETMLQETMRYLHLRIGRRGGPNEMEIGLALKNVRQQRTGRQVFLPPDSNIDRR
jgi:hypothetical protein